MAEPTIAALMLNLQLSISNAERWQLVRISKRHPAVRNMIVKLARQAQIGGTWPRPGDPFGDVPQAGPASAIPPEPPPEEIAADEESFDDEPAEKHPSKATKASKGKH